MSRLKELEAKHAEKVAALDALNTKMTAEGYVFDEADQQAFDELETEAADFLKQIAQTKRVMAAKESSAKQVIATSSPRIEFPSHRELKHFKGPRSQERAFRFGRFMMASIFGHEKSIEWCRDNGVILQRAQSESVNAAGGYLVPEEFSTEIIDLRDQYGLFRRLCQVIPMGRDTITVPRRVGGLTAYAVGEGVAISQSTAGWDNIRLTANKWGVLTLLSTELDEDAAVAVGDLLVGEISYAFANKEDEAGFNGDGSASFHGIRGVNQLFADQVSAGSSTLAGAVDAASGHDTFLEIDTADMSKLMAALPQYAYVRGRVRFYASQYAWGALFQRLIVSQGGITKDDITGAVVFRYLGYPVEIIPSMPNSSGDLSDKAMLLFGDLALAATMGDRRGITVARSTEYKFAEDQIAIKGTERFDINVHDLGSTTVPGPLVALIGE